MPCNIHGCDSMSALSLSTAEKLIPVAKIFGVDAIVTEILKPPERTINTIQQALQYPQVAIYIQNTSVSGSASRKR